MRHPTPMTELSEKMKTGLGTLGRQRKNSTDDGTEEIRIEDEEKRKIRYKFVFHSFIRLQVPTDVALFVSGHAIAATLNESEKATLDQRITLTGHCATARTLRSMSLGRR